MAGHDVPTTTGSNEDRGQALKTLAGLVGLFVAAVYVVGGVVLAGRLGLRQLPSTAVVSQLPREFLVSSGLLVVGIPAVAGGIAYAILPSRYRSGERLEQTVRTLLLIVAVLAIILGGLSVAKKPFPAKACLNGGTSLSGFFIGEAADRTYLGEGGATPRRIISLPSGQVDRLLIGGDAARARCGSSGVR